MKKIKGICILLTLSLLATGCGGDTSAPVDGSMGNESVAASGSGEHQTGEAPDRSDNPDGSSSGNPSGDKEEAGGRLLTHYVSEEGYSKADAWNSCDDTALAAVMKKALAGEKITIACIGGSITQGTISSGSMDSEVPFKKSYAELFKQWWEETFPNAQIEFVNAGIGATDSYLGVHRVGKDVLDYQPDLVLVEFSVNDANSTNSKITYDNLVRRIASYENTDASNGRDAKAQPAVMLLFMGQTNGSNAQEQHVLVGFNYKLPMISYANYIAYAMEQGEYSAKDLSGDTTHPSALGHAITGELLWRYLNQVYANLDSFGEPGPWKVKAITKDMYLNAEILDSESITPDALGSFHESSVFAAFPNDWTTTEGDGGIEFTAEFSRLGILYYRTTDGKSGQFEVYVDGEKVATLDGDFSGGWGNYAESAAVFSGESAEHNVKLVKATDSEAEGFSILGLLVADEESGADE